MRTRSALALLLPFLAAALPTPGLAVEAELRNGGFDDDLSFWSALTCEPEDLEGCENLWTTRDHADSPDSGSLRLRKPWNGGSNLGVGQCLPAQAGQVWSARARTWQDPAAERALAYVQIDFHADESCGSDLSHLDSAYSTAAGSWSAVEAGPVTTPEGAKSFQVRLVVYEQAVEGLDAEAHFDDVALGVFFSDFETGSTGEWTVAQP